jgi:hypothetical protein
MAERELKYRAVGAGKNSHVIKVRRTHLYSAMASGYMRNGHQINERWTFVGTFPFTSISVPNNVSSADSAEKMTFSSTSETTSPDGYIIKNTHTITISTGDSAEVHEKVDLLQLLSLVLQTMQSEPLEREGLRLIHESLNSLL